MSVNNLAKNVSQTQINAQTITTATATTAVSMTSSCFVVHETFPISAFVSPRNFMRLNPDEDETATAFSSAKTFTSSS